MGQRRNIILAQILKQAYTEMKGDVLFWDVLGIKENDEG